MPYQFSINRSGIADFRRGRHVGAGRRARTRAKRDRRSVPALMCGRITGRSRRTSSAPAARGKSLMAGRGAAIWHVNDVDPGGQLEQFAGKMRQAADAAEAKLSLPGCALARLRVHPYFFAGTLLVTTSIFRHGHDQRDRREILARVVGDLFHRWG